MVNTSNNVLFLPYNKTLTPIVQQNRKNPTKAEKKIWYEVLNRKKFKSHKFLRQKPIDRFIVDFYCAQLRLVIEIDGDSHIEKEEYDLTRTLILQEYGLIIVRYTNEQVLTNIDGVYEDLQQKINAIMLP